MRVTGPEAKPAVEMSRAELLELVSRASSLRERIAHPAAFDSAVAGVSRKGAARLKKWCEIVADGDADQFRHRLSFDSLDQASVRVFLTDIARPEVFAVPAWTEVVNEVLRADPDGGNAPVFELPFLQPDAPVPFEELLLPFVAVAQNRLAEAALGYHSLPVQVRGSMEHSLLQALSRISSRVLELEFRTFLACRQLDGLPCPDPARAHESRTAYLEFVADIRSTGWRPLFAEYCVMARLLSVAVLQWVANSAELLARLRSDGADIGRIFGIANPSDLAAIKMDLSDPHFGGKSVVAIEFATGEMLIYKPKDLALEAAYFRFTTWLNTLGADPTFPVLKILERDGYGWVEFVDNRPCDSDEQVGRFYRRSGALLCLLYAFNGTDFHFENLIACAEYPVPVDLETIYSHPMATDDSELTDEVARRLGRSVLATHFLPNPVKGQHRHYDISAIARSADEEGEYEVLTWQHINTDGLAYRYGKVKPKQGDNLPRFEEQYLSPDSNVEDIVDGFQAVYELLTSHREELLATDSPFREVFSYPARFILRSTMHYVSVLNSACHPDCLREGIDFDIQLEVLSRPFLRDKRRPELWPLVGEEVTAFWRTDVPKFTARGDSDSLVLSSGETARACFTDSAVNQSQQNLLRFGEDDLCWQVKLIRGSMDARDAKSFIWYAPPAEYDDEQMEPLDRAQLVDQAVALGHGLERAAIRQANGEPGWLVLKSLPQGDEFALRAMELDLYNGRSGVALFFAALEKVAPGLGFGESARAALAIVRRWLVKADDRDIASLGVGGLLGFPSVAYALARVGVLLDDAGLIEEAVGAARRIGPDLVNGDKAFDVLGGGAGAILCLLACWRACSDPELLAIADAWGRHLVKSRSLTASGHRTWPTLAGKCLTGMSHGAAGIAYALAALFRATNEPDFLDAAKEAVWFEDSQFSLEKSNWPDHREVRYAGKTPEQTGFGVFWCHGAPGIGLARLGGLAVLDSADIRRDIAAALTTTRECDLLPRDHICCGNMGLVETFLTAGQVLGDPSLTREAQRISSRVVARAGRIGDFAITFRHGFRSPNLFMGAAGVGYELLRVAYPDDLPAVLLLA
ncbi:hypothetical protein LAUMK191_01750 [Mycobacterium attenuatum]|nr:hypothetical protein LAUMK191_01750 [Mycobacterium attenuatum]